MLVETRQTPCGNGQSAEIRRLLRRRQLAERPSSRYNPIRPIHCEVTGPMKARPFNDNLTVSEWLRVVGMLLVGSVWYAPPRIAFRLDQLRRPRCPQCGERLCTTEAQNCLECGLDWHGRARPKFHRAWKLPSLRSCFGFASTEARLLRMCLFTALDHVWPVP